MAIQDQASLSIAREYAEKYPRGCIRGGASCRGRDAYGTDLLILPPPCGTRAGMDGNRYIDYWMGHVPCCWAMRTRLWSRPCVSRWHAVRTRREYATRNRLGRLIMDLVPWRSRSSSPALALRPPSWHCVPHEPTLAKVKSSLRVISMAGTITPCVESSPRMTFLCRPVSRRKYNALSSLSPLMIRQPSRRRWTAPDDIAAGAERELHDDQPDQSRPTPGGNDTTRVVLIFDEVVTGFRYALVAPRSILALYRTWPHWPR